MLQSLEEVKKAELISGQPINGVDNPNLFSVDSTEVVQTDADKLEAEEEGEAAPPVKKVEKKEAAKEEVVQEEEEKEEEHEEEEAPKPPAKKVESKDSVQKRIDELTKKRRAAERERDFERSRIAKLEEELKKLKSKVPAEGRPKKEDFEDEDAYLEALVDWKAEQKVSALREEGVKKTETDEERAAKEEVDATLDNMVETGRERYEDFDEIALDTNLKVTPEMMEALLLSDAGADVLYYLGQNPDEAVEISKMSPLKIAREITKLETVLAAKPASKKEEEEEEEKEEVEKKVETPPAPKKKLTKAPAPINPPKQTGQMDRDPTQMSPKEYRAWRERNKE